jgi:D-glycero-alpha-D-manno-heptose-7-phosphate kinase
MVITKTPYRISFFGGGTDLNQWFRENGGAVISTTIDKYCYITCRYLPKFFQHNYRFVYSKVEEVLTLNDITHPAIRGILQTLNWEEGLEMHHDGDLPARSGLGSSSTFTVGLLNTLYALQGKLTSKEELAKKAIFIEQLILKEHVGCQDQIAAAYGGFNKIEFYGENSFKVTPVIIKPDRLNNLQNNLLLFFTGISRFASDIEKSKISNFHSKKAELKKMHEMVDISIQILSDQNKNIDEFGLLLNEAWQFKKSLSDLVSNEFIDITYKKAISAGATGGKVLGAGGGGFMLFYAPGDKHESIRNALSNLMYIPFQFENSGSSIVLYNPNGL